MSGATGPFSDPETTGPSILMTAAAAGLRRTNTLLGGNSRAAFEELRMLIEGMQRIAACLEPGMGLPIRNERDVLDLARARARILLNKMVLMEAMKVDRTGGDPHQKSGKTG
jgi:hypothetical protein